MKITIQKTMYLEEVPEEIDNEFLTINNRIIGAGTLFRSATQNATEGRYIDASEDIERLREVLATIDKNLEEQQSLCLSYEKIRITSQFDQATPQESENVQ
jgi:hypothetical protein|tara:strand:- start:146 stop:448 length:303 start_codon:yes stop_codon:yes gene_type:complete